MFRLTNKSTFAFAKHQDNRLLWEAARKIAVSISLSNSVFETRYANRLNTRTLETGKKKTFQNVKLIIGPLLQRCTWWSFIVDTPGEPSKSDCWPILSKFWAADGPTTIEPLPPNTWCYSGIGSIVKFELHWYRRLSISWTAVQVVEQRNTREQCGGSSEAPENLSRFSWSALLPNLHC